MTHRASTVLSLCLALLTPLAARGQTPEAPADPAPPAGAVPADAVPAEAAPGDVPLEPAPAEVPAETVPAEAAPVMPTAPTDSGLPSQDAAGTPEVTQAAPAEPAAPEPPPEPEPEPVAPPAPAEPPPSSLQTSTNERELRTGKDKPELDEARCAQLFAQGQTALAQTEGCSGGDTPVYAGSQLALSQITAPASRTLPDYDNGFYALNLYLAPRFRLTEKWALFADVTLGYEATTPDDTGKRNEVQSTDSRIVVSGVLGTLGGITFTTGPRIIVPTSKASWAADVYAGLGVSLGAVKNFEVLSGLALQLTGVATHVFSDNLTREIRTTNAPKCVGTSTSEIATIDCSAGQGRVVQDTFRAAASTSLQINDQWSTSLSYVYGWNLVKRFSDDVDAVLVPGLGGDVLVDNVSDNPLEDNRWRRNGNFSVGASYQPAPWMIATLQGNTAVCYDSASGGQSALGGCAGGMKSSDWWLRNPIANKFSTISLQFTIPVDAFIDVVTRKGGNEQKKTAKARAKSSI